MAAHNAVAQDGIEVFSDSVNSARLTPRARLRRLERADSSAEPPVEFWLLEPLKVVLWQQIRHHQDSKGLYTGRVTLQRRRTQIEGADQFLLVPLPSSEGRGKSNAARSRSASAGGIAGGGSAGVAASVDAASSAPGLPLQSMPGSSGRALRTALAAENATKGTSTTDTLVPPDAESSARGLVLEASTQSPSGQRPWVACSASTCTEIIKEPRRNDRCLDSPWSSFAVEAHSGSDGQSAALARKNGWYMRTFQFGQKLHSALLELPNAHQYEFSFLFEPSESSQSLAKKSGLVKQLVPCPIRSKPFQFRIPFAKLYEAPKRANGGVRDTDPMWGNALDLQYMCYRGIEHKNNCILVVDDVADPDVDAYEGQNTVAQAVQFAVRRSVVLRDTKPLSAAAVGSVLKDFFTGGPSVAYGNSVATPSPAKPTLNERTSHTKVPGSTSPAEGRGDEQTMLRRRILDAMPRARSFLATLGIGSMQSESRAFVVVREEVLKKEKAARRRSSSVDSAAPAASIPRTLVLSGDTVVKCTFEVFPKPTTQPGDRLRICLVLYSTLLRQPLVAVVSAPVEISGPKIKLIPAQVGAHINHSNNGGPLPRVGIGGAIKVAVTTGLTVRRNASSPGGGERLLLCKLHRVQQTNPVLASSEAARAIEYADLMSGYEGPLIPSNSLQFPDFAAIKMCSHNLSKYELDFEHPSKASMAERPVQEVQQLMKFFAGSMRIHRPPSQGLREQHLFYCAEFRGNTHGAHNAGLHFFLYLDKNGRPLTNRWTGHFYVSQAFFVALPKLTIQRLPSNPFSNGSDGIRPGSCESEAAPHVDWGEPLGGTLYCDSADTAAQFTLVVCRVVERLSAASTGEGNAGNEARPRSQSSGARTSQLPQASAAGSLQRRGSTERRAGDIHQRRGQISRSDKSVNGNNERARNAVEFFSPNELMLAKQTHETAFSHDNVNEKLVAWVKRYMSGMLAWHNESFLLQNGRLVSARVSPRAANREPRGSQPNNAPRGEPATPNGKQRHAFDASAEPSTAANSDDLDAQVIRSGESLPAGIKSQREATPWAVVKVLQESLVRLAHHSLDSPGQGFCRQQTAMHASAAVGHQHPVPFCCNPVEWRLLPGWYTFMVTDRKKRVVSTSIPFRVRHPRLSVLRLDRTAAELHLAQHRPNVQRAGLCDDAELSQKPLRRRSSGIMQHLRRGTAAHHMCHWAGQTLRVRLDASPQFLQQYHWHLQLEKKSTEGRVDEGDVPHAAVRQSDDMDAIKKPSSDASGVWPEPGNSHPKVVPTQDCSRPPPPARPPSTSGDIELQVLTWGVAALNVVVDSKSGSSSKFIPRWKTVAALPVARGDIVLDDAVGAFATDVLSSPPAGTWDDGKRSSHVDGVDRNGQTGPQYLPARRQRVFSASSSSDESVDDGLDLASSSQGVSVRNGAKIPKAIKSSPTFVQYVFSGEKAPKSTGLYRCVYVVHRPVSAGSFILKSEAELLRERRHEEAQERQRKNELAKQKKVESVDHLRSTADFQLTANTEQGHEPQPTRETVEPDPGSNQRSSTRTDEGDGHPDQAIGGRPFSSSTDKARSKPHGRYIIARSAILQVLGGREDPIRSTTRGFTDFGLGMEEARQHKNAAVDAAMTAAQSRASIRVTRSAFTNAWRPEALYHAKLHSLDPAFSGPTSKSASALATEVKRHFAALWEREQHVMSLARHGFAQRYRPYLWMLLAGIDLAGAMSSPASGSSGVSGCGPAFCISTHKAAFDATLNLKSDEYEEQTILRDIDRTFPDHEYFHVDMADGGGGQCDLYAVLRAVCIKHSDIGYCQGLNCVAGAVLISLKEAQQQSIARQFAIPCTSLADESSDEEEEVRCSGSSGNSDTVQPASSGVPDMLDDVTEVEDDFDEEKSDDGDQSDVGPSTPSDQDSDTVGREKLLKEVVVSGAPVSQKESESDHSFAPSDGSIASIGNSSGNNEHTGLGAHSDETVGRSKAAEHESEKPCLENQVTAFVLLSRLFSDASRFRLGNCFRRDMPQVELSMFQFQFLLKEVDLELYEHLEISREKTAGGIEPTCRLYAMQWFLTLFCSSSLRLGQRVLDLFFVHGWTVVHRIALAVMLGYRNELMAADLFGAIEAVSPAALRRLSEEDISRLIEPATSALVQVVSPRKLADLEVMWKERQQQIADEATADKKINIMQRLADKFMESLNLGNNQTK